MVGMPPVNPEPKKLVSSPSAAPAPTNMPQEGGTTTEGRSGYNRSQIDTFQSANQDFIPGTIGPDTIVGKDGDDTILSGGGDDTVDGGSGDDIITGGVGNDTIRGGSGNDRLDGDANDDHISGGSGNDEINGGFGDDVLLGDGGNDTIIGGAGDDRIDGGAGSNTLTGGSGDDTFVVRPGGTATWNNGQLIISYPNGEQDVITDYTTDDTVVDTNGNAVTIPAKPAGGEIKIPGIDGEFPLPTTPPPVSNPLPGTPPPGASPPAP